MNREIFFDTLLQTSSDGVLFVDAQGKVLRMNTVSKTVFSVSADQEDYGFVWDLLFDLDERASLQAFFEQIFENRPTSRPYYGRIHLNENKTIPISLQWNYVLQNQNLEGLVCIIHDMSAVSDQKSQLGPTMIEQVQYSRLATIEEVVARITHELNQPLSAIVNYSGGTLRRLETEYPNSDIMQSMKMILRQAQRAGDVIDRMKMFLKKGELRKELLNINDVIREVLDCMRPELFSAQVHLDVQLGNFVPAVMVDKVQIEQVLLNLIQNALESMRDVEPSQRKITINTHTNNMEQLVVKITDCGHGVQSEEAEKIFEAFFTTKNTGMGIGLAISQSIMKAHGGEIVVQSDGISGSTFILYLNN